MRPSLGAALVLALLLAVPACGASSSGADDGGAPGDVGALDTLPASCDFDYDDVFTYLGPPSPGERAGRGGRAAGAASAAGDDDGWLGDSAPVPGLRRVPRAGATRRDVGDIVIPAYSDTMPLFPRGAAWTEARRCYETPGGVRLLTEAEAHALYRDIAELTTGVPLDATPGVRTVVGVRGSHPGRFAFNGDLPDRFNDTIVLLWIDADGAHVREFPVTTAPGPVNFGVDSSSSLRPNRRYHYVNGWHNDYNAFHIDESGYLVMDDTNHNGHWDSDRNGWLPPLDATDHERVGSAHNIHTNPANAPLGAAAVGRASAGCQTIPGIANWIEFITNGWTELGDPLSYFLVDVRDIDPRVWSGECTPDGTHACPYPIDALPFAATGDTRTVTTRDFAGYNCAPDDAGGPEVVYRLTVDAYGTLTAGLSDPGGGSAGLAVHLLDADDPQACLARGAVSVSRALGPGRYFVIVDTAVTGGVEQAGAYRLDVTWQ